MNIPEVIDQFFNDYILNTTENPPTYEKQILPETVRSVSKGPKATFNTVFIRDFQSHLESIIDREMQFFSTLRYDFQIPLFSYNDTKSLQKILESKGFKRGDEGAFLAIEAEKLVAQRIPGVELVEAKSLEDIQKTVCMMETLHQTKFDWLESHLWGFYQKHPTKFVVVQAKRGNTIICNGWMGIKGRFAHLWGGSTLVEERGKGVYSAVVARRGEIAKNRGVKYLVVEAGPLSEPILRKLGFTELFRTVDYYTEFFTSRN